MFGVYCTSVFFKMAFRSFCGLLATICFHLGMPDNKSSSSISTKATISGTSPGRTEKILISSWSPISLASSTSSFWSAFKASGSNGNPCPSSCSTSPFVNFPALGVYKSITTLSPSHGCTSCHSRGENITASPFLSSISLPLASLPLGSFRNTASLSGTSGSTVHNEPPVKDVSGITTFFEFLTLCTSRCIPNVEFLARPRAEKFVPSQYFFPTPTRYLVVCGNLLRFLRTPATPPWTKAPVYHEVTETFFPILMSVSPSSSSLLYNLRTSSKS